MTTLVRALALLFLAILITATVLPLAAQGLSEPLSVQGLDQRAVPGARTHALGGVISVYGGDALSLFNNPAGLATLQHTEFRVGTSFQTINTDQSQEWKPTVIYVPLSLLIENNYFGMDYTGRLKPYDSLPSDWKHSTTSVRMPTAAVAVPFTLWGRQIVAGIGAAEVIDCNSYFQNNNILSPYLGVYRPAPFPRLTSRADTIRADWYQYLRSREGGIYGITPAIAFRASRILQIGVSATWYTGKSSEKEARNGRGKFVGGYQQYFRMDSSYFHSLSYGNSTYRGFSGTLGAVAGNNSVQLGGVVRFPLTLTRSWDRISSVDTTGTPSVTAERGEEKLQLPWNYLIGLAVHPSKYWTLAIEYAVNRNENMSVTGDTLADEVSWMSGQDLKFGTEYIASDWLTLRAGYSENVQVYAPVGDALPSEPAKGSIYSGGVGLTAGNVHIDITYEYSHLRVLDIWMSNTNNNSRDISRIFVETGYSF